MYPAIKRPKVAPKAEQTPTADQVARQSPYFRKKEREYNAKLAQLTHTRPDLSAEQRAEFALRCIFPEQFPENRAPKREKS